MILLLGQLTFVYTFFLFFIMSSACRNKKALRRTLLLSKISFSSMQSIAIKFLHNFSIIRVRKTCKSQNPFFPGSLLISKLLQTKGMCFHFGAQKLLALIIE